MTEPIQYRPMPSRLAAEDLVPLIRRLTELYNKLAYGPLGMSTAWEVQASKGKPLLYGGRRGLLAYGTIGTWDEFELIKEVVNNLSSLLGSADEIVALREFRSSIAGFPSGSPMRRYRHSKGGTYVELLRATSTEGAQMGVVVYRADIDGSIWVRPESEFDDGRFVEIDHV